MLPSSTEACVILDSQFGLYGRGLSKDCQQLFFYRFEADGFDAMGSEFCIDDAAAKRAAFDTAIELSRLSGELVRVTVFDSQGRVLGCVPELKPRARPKADRTVRK